MNEGALKKILAQLPKEVSTILEAMQSKITILENDKVLLQQENYTLLRNQDMLMQAHKELHLENLALKEDLKHRPPEGEVSHAKACDCIECRP